MGRGSWRPGRTPGWQVFDQGEGALQVPRSGPRGREPPSFSGNQPGPCQSLWLLGSWCLWEAAPCSQRFPASFLVLRQGGGRTPSLPSPVPAAVDRPTSYAALGSASRLETLQRMKRVIH